MGIYDRHGHQDFGVCTRVSEHEPLVTGPPGIDPHGDIRGLLVDGCQNSARLPVKPHIRTVIADFLYYRAGNLRNFDIDAGGYFACDDDKTGRRQGFTRNAAARIILYNGIEDGV